MKIKVFNPGVLILSFLVILLAASSCSKDDDINEEPVYHQSYVQGKINGVTISMDDKNAYISSEKSSYYFTPQEKDKFPSVFDWEVKLIDTPDSTVTMYLHLINVDRVDNNIIYSPNTKYHGLSENRCRIVVKNKKDGTEAIFHPKDKFGVDVMWKTFLVTQDERMEKHKGFTLEYQNEYTWSGIVGFMQGRLTNEDAPGHDIIIERLDFRLY